MWLDRGDKTLVKKEKIFNYGAILLALCLTLNEPVLASETSQANSSEKKVQPNKRKTLALREKTYRKLADIQGLVDADKFSLALESLHGFMKLRKLNDYELGMAWNIYGYVYYSLNQIDASISAYQKVLEMPLVPDSLQKSVRLTLAQVYFSAEKYQPAVKLMKETIKAADNPSETMYLLLAQGYFQLDQFEACIDTLSLVIDARVKLGTLADENWLLLLQSSLYALERHEERKEVLEELAATYPKKSYLLNLASAYGMLADYGSQLSTLELLYRRGMLDDEKTLIYLSQLLYQQEAPFKAARVILKAVEKGKIKSDREVDTRLTSYLNSAKEYELSNQYLLKLADLSEDGDAEYQLGVNYYYLGQWKSSAISIERALEKGLLKNQNSAVLTAAQAYININDYTAAVVVLKRANVEDDSYDLTKKWLAFVKSEEERFISITQ